MTICAPWSTEADLCSPCDDYQLSGDIDLFLQAASEVLYHHSIQQFPGLCDIQIAPCSNTQWTNWNWATYSNLMWRSWPNWSICSCRNRDTCSCNRFSAINLAPTPVTEVTEVIIDGAGFTDYELVDSQTLLRTDELAWPCCDDTFAVSFTYGREPPQIGIQAAAVLACELYLSCQPEDIAKKCRLPRNVVSISRQGVSMVIANAANLFVRKSGQPIHTGIWEIDLFLSTYNPYGSMAQSVVLSPDVPPVGRRIGP